MIQENMTKNDELPTKETDKVVRKPYHSPKLEKLGDLRTLTLGVSGAPQDFSGGQINQRTP